VSQADVTIAVATRNRSDRVAQALDSIARQTHPRYEVFVSDDGSTAEHAEGYRTLLGRYDDRFHLLQPLQPSKVGSGPSLTRNRAVEAGSGRYVAFLDDDDTWTWDDYLKVAVETLDRTGTDLFCGDMQGFRGDTLVWDTWFPERRGLVAGERVGEDPSIYRSTRGAFVDVARHRVAHPNMIVVRRQLFETVGGFLVRLRSADDLEFVLRVADRVDVVMFCEQCVARYRFPEGDAHSLTQSMVQHHLQALAAAQHLRMVGRSTDVKRAARKIEAWSMRQLSQDMQEEGRFSTGVALALQAVVVYPTAGAVLDLVRAIVLPTRKKP
jgi:hypothetical protein